MIYKLKPIKLIIILIIVMLFSKEAKSQWAIGIEGGYVNNHQLTDISNRVETNNQNGNSFGVGILAKYTFTKEWLSMETGLTFIQKNYSFVRTGKYQGIYENFINNYVQLPLGLSFRLFNLHGFKTYIDAGMYFGYWASSYVNGVTPNIINVIYQKDGNNYQLVQANASYSEKYSFDSRRDSRFEFGLYTGLTLAYDFYEKYGIFIRGRFYQSTTDQQKKYATNQIAQYNQSFFVSAGFMYTFYKK